MRQNTSRAGAAVDGFVATTSCTMDLDRPLRDVVMPTPRSGGRYARCLVLVRLHEDPLGVVEVDVVQGRVRAPDVAEAVFSSLRSELTDHVRHNSCSAPPASLQALLRTGLGNLCRGAQRTCDGALPPVALIIPTAGRPDDIRRCLARLAVLDYPHLDIVVVDNRPDEHATRQVVEAAAGLDGRVRYVAERRPGSSVARNRGLAETRADIVAFTDDDVSVDPQWVRWMVEPFMQDVRVRAVTGLVLPASYDTPAQQLFEEYAGFGKGFDRRIYDIGANRPQDQLLYPYWGAPFGSGNSMAFRRHALVAIGGFDPALGAGSPALAGADIDSFTHIVLRGGRLVYEPRAIVWHEHRREEGALSRQLFNYGVGSTAILTKWLLRDPRVVLALVRAIGTIAAGALRAKAGRASETPRELSRLNRQLVMSSERSRLTRQLRGFASGPLLYLRSQRWAKRQRLDAVLTDGRPAGA
jgi:GT2 family glycosyltransferase